MLELIADSLTVRLEGSDAWITMFLVHSAGEIKYGSERPEHICKKLLQTLEFTEPFHPCGKIEGVEAGSTVTLFDPLCSIYYTFQDDLLTFHFQDHSCKFVAKASLDEATRVIWTRQLREELLANGHSLTS